MSRAYKPTLLSESDKVERSEVGPEVYTVYLDVVALTPSLDYGITNNFGLSASLPYVWHTGTHRVLSDLFFTEKEKGVSDLILTARYSWRWTLFRKNLAMATMGGVTVPVTEKKLGILQDHIDFTTETVDPVFGLASSYGLNSKTIARATFFTRQVIGTASDEQQVGSYYVYTAELRRLLGKGKYTVYGRFLTEIREQYTIGGRGYRNSGGEWYFGVFGGSMALISGAKAGLGITAELELPISIRVNGTQPVQGTDFRVNLSSNFTL